MSAWVYLALAILFEVSGTSLMKLSAGFTKWLPSLGMFVCYLLSLSVLNLALKKIDVGVAYAVWSGVGTALIAMIGFYFFQESFSWFKFFCILLIIIGVAGLNWQASHA